MIQRKIRGVQYIAINTDVQDFENCLYDEKLIIGTRVTGAGEPGATTSWADRRRRRTSPTSRTCCPDATWSSSPRAWGAARVPGRLR
jgi:hypothetical protein